MSTDPGEDFYNTLANIFGWKSPCEPWPVVVEVHEAGVVTREVQVRCGTDPAAAWESGFIAGVNAADSARNGVFDLYDKYCRNPYERPTNG